ncbi:hypothetical protein B0H10DRAFT_2059890 [Mycena sp. CBHHK59/15]|nr:hypothetical protein B0H10DRAFT_2059890 [Mycena sp. CBHHK59/15]
MLQSGRAYYIVNKASGTYLDRTSDGPIIIHPYNGGGNNQKWIAFRNGPYWTLQNGTGGYLTTSSFDHPDGLTLSTGHIRAGWQLQNTSGDDYTICLWTMEPQDLPHTSTAYTGLYMYHGSDSQVWQFEEVTR